MGFINKNKIRRLVQLLYPLEVEYSTEENVEKQWIKKTKFGSHKDEINKWE